MRIQLCWGEVGQAYIYSLPPVDVSKAGVPPKRPNLIMHGEHSCARLQLVMHVHVDRYMSTPLRNGSVLLCFNVTLIRQGLVWLSTAKSWKFR